jgi:hypothetical protein
MCTELLTISKHFVKDLLFIMKMGEALRAKPTAAGRDFAKIAAALQRTGRGR